jgi:predicted permease
MELYSLFRNNNKVPSLILIADGIYLYFKKNENSDTQRKLYSGLKKRHLIKPFVIIAENNVIISIYGPFSVTSKDAKILELILNDDSALKNLIKKM